MSARYTVQKLGRKRWQVIDSRTGKLAPFGMHSSEEQAQDDANARNEREEQR